MEKPKGIHVIEPDVIKEALASRNSQQLIGIAYELLDDQTSLLKVMQAGEYGLIPQVIGQLYICASLEESRNAHIEDDDIIASNSARILELNDLAETLTNQTVGMEEGIDIRSSSVGSQVKKNREIFRDSWHGSPGGRTDAA